MSNPKITAKNLSYDTSLPPFLQRLHHSTTSNSAPLDGRHERAIARPKRARDADADKEDEPVFVDEETGEIVSAEDFRALGSSDAAAGNKDNAAEDKRMKLGETKLEENGREEKGEREKQAAKIGGLRKRKVAKVIGGDDAGADDMTDEQTKRNAENSGDAPTLTTNKKQITRKSKDKEKKVKLSFGEDEEA